MSDLLTAKQAAAILGLAPVTVRNYCIAGRLRCVKPASDYPWRIARAEVERYQATRRSRGRPRTDRPSAPRVLGTEGEDRNGQS